MIRIIEVAGQPATLYDDIKNIRASCPAIREFGSAATGDKGVPIRLHS